MQSDYLAVRLYCLDCLAVTDFINLQFSHSAKGTKYPEQQQRLHFRLLPERHYASYKFIL